MIKQAGLEDIPEIIHWGRKFHAVSPFSGRVDFKPDDLARSLEGMVTNGAVFINGHGICGGVIFPLYFNAGASVAVELFWFAEKGGRDLRKAFEAWARQSGATAIQMTCLADENEPRMRKHYARLGFSPMETSFYKEL